MNRILVVENDESMGEILQGALSAAPDRLDPVVTGSGEEALRLLEREDFDTLLVDLTLPGIDGIEVLVRAKQLHPAVRTFAMSAAVSPEQQAAALDSGVAEILRKPLDLDALLETLTGETSEPGLLTALGGDFDVADLCLQGALSGNAGGIQAGRNGSKGLLAMADGALIHASTGELQGLAAFKRILGWKRLDFDWMSAAAARPLAQNVRLDASWLLKISNRRQLPEAGVPENCKAEGLLSGIHLHGLLSLLEKKRETGNATVTTAGRFGVLVLRDGQILHADTQKSHGQAAIDEILSWTAVRVMYSRTATRPAANDSAPPAAQTPDGGGSAMKSLTKLLDELAGEATDVLAAGIVRVSDGRSVIESTRDPALASSIAAYAAVVRSHLKAAELLGGSGALGDTEDLLITMDKAFLLIRMLGPDHFQGLVLARPANPSLGRLLMRRFEPFFLDALHSGSVGGAVRLHGTGPE